MPNIQKIGTLAAAGSTGNNTHASVAVPRQADALAVKVEVTAVGGTPQYTYKVQGSLDEPGVADASSDWFDLMMLPNDSDTAVATKTDNPSAVGNKVYFIEVARRFVRKARIIVSANTNTTYNAELWSGKF